MGSRATVDAAPVGRLVRRADFVACARAKRIPSAAFLVQARSRGDDRPARFGVTVTKKTGGAVERNRIRRRLREAIRLGAPHDAAIGADIVLVANRTALKRPFAALQADLAAALRRSAAARPPHGRTDG